MSADPVPRSRRKRLGPSERRDSILDSALSLVTRLDSFSVTIAEIADEEGVSKPVVYDHFANIDDLLAALFNRERSLAVTTMLEICARRLETDDRGERVLFALGLASSFFELVGEHPERWILTFQPPLGLTPEARELTETGLRLVHEAVIDLIAWTVPDLPRADLGLTAHALQAILERTAILIVKEPEQYSPESMLAFASTHIGWWLAGQAAVPRPS